MNKMILKLLQCRNQFTCVIFVIARIAMGVFFAISGFYKLFNPINHQVLLKTLLDAGIPFPHFNVIFVPTVEFIGGLMLIFGLASSLVAIALCFLILVAILTDGIHTIPKNLSFFPWLSYFLYLPEVLIEILLLWILFVGGGKLSLDSVIFKKWMSKRKTS